MQKQCLVCNANFEAKRTTAKFCSDVCRVKYNRENLSKAADAAESYLRRPVLTAEERYNMFLDQLPKTEWIETGTSLDQVTLIPKDKITLIYGKYGIGKTTLAHLMASKSGLKTLYIDTEAALTPERLRDLEIDPRDFTTRRVTYMEDVYELLMDDKTMEYDLIVWDSVAGTSFHSEVEGGAFERQMGVKALIMNKLMRILPNKLAKSGTTLVLINQEREGIGQYEPNYVPAGKGQMYSAGLVVRLTGNYPKVKAELKKNRFGDIKTEEIKIGA